MVSLTTGDEKNANPKRTVVLLFGLGCSLVAGVLSKNILLLAIPVIMLEVGLNRKKILFNQAVRPRAALLWTVIGCGLLIILICWMFLIPGFPLFARFTPDYYAFLIKFFIHTPRPNFLEAITGPLISPGKSLFFFSPVLLLSLWGLIFNFKKSWPAWVFLFSIIIAQAFFYDADWSGHINWGARYLLPAIPLLLITAVPLVDRMLKTWQGRTILIGLGLFSLFVQILGVLVPVRDFYVVMYSGDAAVNEWSTVWQARYSIFKWDISYLIRGQPVDLALVRAPDKIFTVLLVSIGILGYVFLSMQSKKMRKFPGLVLVLCLGLNLLMLTGYKNDPVYYLSRRDLRSANQYLSQNIQTGDVVFVRSYGTPAWNYAMNWTGSNVHWTALPYFYLEPSLVEKYQASQNPEDALSTQTVTLLNESLQTNGTVWLVSPSDSPGADLNLEISWLADRASNADCQEFKGINENTEVCKFLLP
jgi:hypothetical protein